MIGEMNMCTMVIADDEPIARKSLELFIRKEFEEIQVIGVVEDGVELVDFVEKYQPDIAIVDINMPGLNGIKAIDILLGKEVRTRFIINTAYGEFEYVKKALDLKVDGYLVKPGSYEESVKTIKKLCDIVKQEKNKDQKQDKMKSLLHAVSPVLENEILLSVYSEKPAVEDFKAFCEVNNINFKAGCITTLIGMHKNALSKKELREIIHNALYKICDYLVSIMENSITVFLFIPETIKEQEKEGWVCDVMQLVTAQMKNATGIEYRVGLGDIYETFAKMSLSYHQSMEAFQKNRNDEKEQKDDRQDNKVSIYVERAIQYIENHYSEDISLDVVAEQIKISSYYLSRLMKLEAGITFTEHLTNIRMKEAVRLSVETRLPMKEIAERCGYYNVTYFCKVFKKQTGKTISEYRRNL